MKKIEKLLSILANQNKIYDYAVIQTNDPNHLDVAIKFDINSEFLYITI